MLQLEKASLAKVKDHLSEPTKSIALDVGFNLIGMKVSYDETWVLAWSNQKLFIFDLCGMNPLKHSECITTRPYYWSLDFEGMIMDATFSTSNNYLSVIVSDQVHLIEIFSSEIIGSIFLKDGDETVRGLCISSQPVNESLFFAVGSSNGKVFFLSFNINSNINEVSYIAEFDLSCVEIVDPFEIHSLLWFKESTIVLGLRPPGVPFEDINYDIYIPPTIIILEINIGDQFKEVVSSVVFPDPLNFNSLDRPWEHRFFFEYIDYSNCIVIASTWAQCLSILQSPKDSFEWKIAEIRDPSDDLSTEQNICGNSMWNLCERPWNWIKDGDPANPEDELVENFYILGICLSKCVTSKIVPYHFWGDQVELDTKPDFHPSPALLIFNTDGIIELVALADQHYPIEEGTRGIPEMLTCLKSLPTTRNIPLKGEILF